MLLGSNFGAAHESDVRRESGPAERQSHSPDRQQHRQQSDQDTAQQDTHRGRNEGRSRGRPLQSSSAAPQHFQQPLSSDNRSIPREQTWNRPRLPSSTHERAVTPSRTFDRPREQDPRYQTLHTSAYQTPEESKKALAAAGVQDGGQDRPGQEKQNGRKDGQKGDQGQPSGGEMDATGESRLQQSLREQCGSRAQHSSERVMNILQVGPRA